MKKRIIFLSLLWLAGCSTSAPLFTSDGRPTSQISCSSQDDCQSRAQGVCRGGSYDLLRDTYEDGMHSLVIACRPGAPG